MIFSRIALLMLLLVTIAISPLSGQDTASSRETTARVPELDEFHTVIARLWHDAWPKKDTATLAQMLPEIQKGAARVTEAALPGILREKKEAWDAGVKKLNEAVAEYAKAVESGNGERLLSAAEQLHMRYEGLVRAIRPALKEIDEFHSVLYLLYHYYVPQYDLPNIQQATGKLTETMAALEKATLPQRLAGKSEAFNKAREQLAESVAALNRTLKTEDEAGLKDSLKGAVDAVHGKYLALEKVFE